MRKTYRIATLIGKSTIREEVEAVHAFAALEKSQLALNPFLEAVTNLDKTEVIITNANNTKETLTISYDPGR